MGRAVAESDGADQIENLDGGADAVGRIRGGGAIAHLAARVFPPGPDAAIALNCLLLPADGDDAVQVDDLAWDGVTGIGVRGERALPKLAPTVSTPGPGSAVAL